MELFGPFVVIAFVALFIGLWRWSVLVERKRTEAIAAWARGRKLMPARAGLPPGCDGFELLRRGRSRKSSNCWVGRPGGSDVVVFDWTYVTGSGKNETTHHCSAVALLPGVRLRPLRIREETLLDRMGEMIGMNDIDFESAEFSRTFHVSADDRRWAYDVITPQAMELLLGSPRFRIEMHENGVLLWRDRRFEMVDFSAALQLGEQLLQAIQPAVRRELGLA